MRDVLRCCERMGIVFPWSFGMFPQHFTVGGACYRQPGKGIALHIEELRRFCLGLPGAHERRPFARAPELLALTVGARWFALIDTEAPPGQARVNLKTDPDEAEALRRAHTGIVPGWHMNKRHWNTVLLDADVPDELLRALVEISHGLVLDALPRRERLRVLAGGTPQAAPRR